MTSKSLKFFKFEFDIHDYVRVHTDPGKVWKVMEFKVEIFQVWKIMENDLRYGWKSHGKHLQNDL